MFFNFLKIIIYLNYVCHSNCLNDDKDTIYDKVEYFNIPNLIINLGLDSSMIPKIDNEITRSTSFLEKLKSRVIFILNNNSSYNVGFVVLYCLNFVFIIFQYFLCQYVILALNVVEILKKHFLVILYILEIITMIILIKIII